MKFDAIIFDFDGIIADTEPLHFATFRSVIQGYGMECSWAEYQEKYIGCDDRDLFRLCFSNNKRTLDLAGLQVCIDEKAKRFAAVVETTDVQAYPGVVELLRELVLLQIPLGLCSGALLSDVTPILAKFDLLDIFLTLSTAELVERSKPDPMPYRHCLGALEEVLGHALDPACCLAVEDTPAGLEAATGAGLMTLGVGNTHPVAMLSQASVVLPSFDDVRYATIESMLTARKNNPISEE